mmetsp:Transcript_1181/g.1906  ORF Transcript_1181/g.1906 Transcript_1181/m.1906 type:complete len:355 (+) Transcript_1181:134-1198(+)|eukprot:CAMPEP_0196812950 /NCGR_PEP_ID=MMETSP1362-20130617/32491_1 /TAXON_ID=163516 /ORGANISM="Leptocylindrus danicus, Strain CCMP1856" /LENGTH=354 /DNA_ID=CAMNT_0042188917 /DNA_START=130 /DNA_END=1194 /DNA_ORIENTATION=+
MEMKTSKEHRHQSRQGVEMSKVKVDGKRSGGDDCEHIMHSILRTKSDLSLIEKAEVELEPLFAEYDRCSLSFTSEDEPQDEFVSDAFLSMSDTHTHSVHEYMNGREMSPLQEKWNALTVVPSPLFCMYFILSSLWLSDDDIARATIEDQTYEVGNDECVNLSFLPKFYAAPPAPVFAIAIGIILHFPFSFLYHWKYAIELPPGLPRIGHWSRRLDHCFIHVISSCISLGTSGNWNYFYICSLFNLDCAMRHFRKTIFPRRNQIRLALSIFLYAVPILMRGEMVVFLQLFLLMGIAGWFFITYPIGGWSHAAFHVVIAFVPPLLMKEACNLFASQHQIQVAAKCAMMKDLLSRAP